MTKARSARKELDDHLSGLLSAGVSDPLKPLNVLCFDADQDPQVVLSSRPVKPAKTPCTASSEPALADDDGTVDPYAMLAPYWNW